MSSSSSSLLLFRPLPSPRSPRHSPRNLYRIPSVNLKPKKQFINLKRVARNAVTESSSSSDSPKSFDPPDQQFLLQELADSFNLPPDYFSQLPSDLRLDLNDAAFDLSNGPVMEQILAYAYVSSLFQLSIIRTIVHP
ncbi:hypothetical protein Tco_0963791 [Tanacetum coccineum]